MFYGIKARALEAIPVFSVGSGWIKVGQQPEISSDEPCQHEGRERLGFAPAEQSKNLHM